MEQNRLVRLEVIDTETGEIKESRPVVRRNRKPEYSITNHRGNKMLAKMNLSKNEYRVLFMLLGVVGYKNLLFVNKTKMAEEFKCDRVMLSKTISSLVKREILIQINSGYRFNNAYVKCGE